MSDIGNFIKYDTIIELDVGRSFYSNSKQSYHQFKYDFTPAAIDKNQEAQVIIGDKNDVTIRVPHIEGSTEKYTEFTGNRQPCTNKECILIYDVKSGKFILERLESNVFLKKNRSAGTNKAAIKQRPETPTNERTIKKGKIETTAQLSASTSSDSKKDDIPIKQKTNEKPHQQTHKASNEPSSKDYHSKHSTKESTPVNQTKNVQKYENMNTSNENPSTFVDDLDLSDSDNDSSEM